MNAIIYLIILPGILLLFLIREYPSNKSLTIVTYFYILYSIALLFLIIFIPAFSIQIGPLILRKYPLKV